MRGSKLWIILLLAGIALVAGIIRGLNLDLS